MTFHVTPINVTTFHVASFSVMTFLVTTLYVTAFYVMVLRITKITWSRILIELPIFLIVKKHLSCASSIVLSLTNEANKKQCSFLVTITSPIVIPREWVIYKPPSSTPFQRFTRPEIEKGDPAPAPRRPRTRRACWERPGGQVQVEIMKSTSRDNVPASAGARTPKNCIRI